MTEDEKDYFEERTAIMEFDGGLSREAAEKYAMDKINQGLVSLVERMEETDERHSKR